MLQEIYGMLQHFPHLRGIYGKLSCDMDINYLTLGGGGGGANFFRCVLSIGNSESATKKLSGLSVVLMP